MSTRSRHTWAPGLFVFLLVMGLVYTSASWKRANDRIDLVQTELALRITQLEAAHDASTQAAEQHLDALGALGDDLHSCEVELDEKAIHPDKPHHREHSTPVFAHEWTF